MLCCTIKKKRRIAAEEEPHYSCIDRVQNTNVGGADVNVVRNQAYGTHTAPIYLVEERSLPEGANEYNGFIESADCVIAGLGLRGVTSTPDAANLEDDHGAG